MSVHFLLLHYRTFEKEFLLLAAIREFDDIDTDQFQALSSQQSRRVGIVTPTGAWCGSHVATQRRLGAATPA